MATKDKLINLEDLKVLSDHVEGEVTDLKSDLSEIQDVLEMPLHIEVTEDFPAVDQASITVAEGFSIVSGNEYRYGISLASASERPVYVHIRKSDRTIYKSINLDAGQTELYSTFTATESFDNAIFTIADINRAISGTVILEDLTSVNAIDRIDAHLTELDGFTGRTDSIYITPNTYITTPNIGGTANMTQTALSGCASASIACVSGEIFTLSGTPRANSGTRAYAWVNSSNKVVYRYNDTAVMDKVVITAPTNGHLIVNFVTTAPYSVRRGLYDLNTKIIENSKDIIELYKIKTSPIETLPFYIKNELSYRPLGQLQKGYLCLVCDDGTAGLGTYTIPMLTQKNVPCTFGLWSTSYQNDLEQRRFDPSVILQTDEGVQQVKTAITNLGCSVAQHGHEYWTDLTEQQLNDFFDSEATRFAELDIPVSGAVYPGHCVDNRVRAIVGGRFGSIRSGYNGHLSKQDMLDGISGDVFTPYGLYTGARSNCYSYTSFNITDSDKDINTLKTMLDDAIANNYVMITHWHDWNFIDSDADYLANRAKLEAFIDYAKTTAVTFCTLGDIPTLR